MRPTAIQSETAPATQEPTDAGSDEEKVQAVLEVTGSGQRSLEGDVAELKEAVTVLQEQTVALDGRFDGFRDEIVARLEASEERVKGEIAAFRSEVDGRFAGIDSKFAGIDSRFASIDSKFASIDGKFASIDGKFEIVDIRFKAVMNEIAALRGEVTTANESLEARLKLIVWLVGAGLTLYTGTTISLMVLLFRSVVA